MNAFACRFRSLMHKRLLVIQFYIGKFFRSLYSIWGCEKGFVRSFDNDSVLFMALLLLGFEYKYIVYCINLPIGCGKIFDFYVRREKAECYKK